MIFILVFGLACLLGGATWLALSVAGLPTAIPLGAALLAIFPAFSVVCCGVLFIALALIISQLSRLAGGTRAAGDARKDWD